MLIRTRTRAACAAMLSAGFVSVASADVQGYSAGYQLNYMQTDAQVDLFSCAFFWGINGEPGDAASATLTSTLGAVYDSVEVVPGIFQGGVSFTDPAAMFAEFPLGTCTLAIDGGVLGVQDGDLELPDPMHFPDTIPMFDPTQVTEYQAIDATNDYTFRFNSFTSAGNVDAVYLVIDAYPSTARVFLGLPELGATSWTVPAGTLRQNRRFRATLYFFGQFETPNAGFAGCRATSLGWYSTSIQLRTGQCPPDFNGDGFVDFFDYLDFVEGFEGGDPDADFNGDGFLDFFDYTDFVFGFENGC